MTGAGAASLAFVKETAFETLPGTPTYTLPGRNPTIQNLRLDNQLQRLRTPDNAEAVDSLAGNLDGAFAVTYAMSNDTHADVRDIVFNDDGGGFTSGLATTSQWFVGIDYLSGGATSTAERVLKGCIPLEYSISYDQGTNTVQESLTMGYADEDANATLTPSSVTKPTDGNDVPFHGTTLQVDGTTVSKLQSATLRFQNISRFQRGPSRTPVAAVLANPQTMLDAAAIYAGDDYLELAYGSSASTSPQDTMSSVAGSLGFDVDGTTVATYTLPKLTPDTYNWDAIINADADMTDSVTYHVNGGVSIA